MRASGGSEFTMRTNFEGGREDFRAIVRNKTTPECGVVRDFEWLLRRDVLANSEGDDVDVSAIC